ncbi:hypothetical protein AB0H12_44895 [Actinosynnema sp. NPDC023794]
MAATAWTSQCPGAGVARLPGIERSTAEAERRGPDPGTAAGEEWLGCAAAVAPRPRRVGYAHAVPTSSAKVFDRASQSSCPDLSRRGAWAAVPFGALGMTVNDPFKTRVRSRMARTRENYTTAATALRRADAAGPGSAARLHGDLADAFHAAGWPVQVEEFPIAGGLRLHAGPATLSVGRDGAGRPASGPEHPDDPRVVDPDSPLRIVLWAPLGGAWQRSWDRRVGIDGRILPTDRPARELVALTDSLIAAARADDTADAPDDAECGICGDSHPAAALITPTSTCVPVCPCCVFDGDVVYAPDAVRVAAAIDRGDTAGLTLPAGWSAVGVLLSCLAGMDPGPRLDVPGWDREVPFPPRERWRDPLEAWIWLPAAPHRPVALARLGCGARLGRVVDELRRTHPGLRAMFRTQEHRVHLGRDEPDEPAAGDSWRVPEQILDRLWPAAVAYAVALTTQTVERPGHRPAWHVFHSLELADLFTGPHRDAAGVHTETVLYLGIRLICAALGQEV